MTAPTSRRITVVAPRGRVDVSLPAQSPIAELLPALVYLSGAARGGQPGGWALSRLGGTPLATATTVAAAGIRDGEVLYLNPAAAVPEPMVFDDVVDAIASAAHDRPGRWGPETSRRVGAALAGLATAGIAAALASAGLPWPSTPVAAGAVAVLLLVAGGALARVSGDSMTGAAVVAGALPAAAIGGATALPGSAWHAPASVGLGLAAAAVLAVLGTVVVAGRAGWFVAAFVAAAVGAAAAAATAAFAAPPTTAAAVVAVLAVALGPAFPPLALRLGRLPAPRLPSDVTAFRRDDTPVAGPAVTHGTQIARDALAALLTAASVCALGAATLLLHAGNGWAWSLTAAAGLALTLRARAYAGIGQRAALLAGGVTMLAGAAVRAAVSGGTGERLGLAAALALAGVVCATCAVRAPQGTPSPYRTRLLDGVELLAMLSLAPLAAAQTGVFSALRGLGG
jgi:type VII secretion integral membrane protein EccD